MIVALPSQALKVPFDESDEWTRSSTTKRAAIEMPQNYYSVDQNPLSKIAFLFCLF